MILTRTTCAQLSGTGPVAAELRAAAPMVLHPIIPALISLAAIVVGLLGSIWTEEIKSAMPFSLVQPTWRVMLFWAFAVGSTATFFSRQTAIDRERKSAQDLLFSRANDLFGKTSELKDLIQTMPPRSFLDRFASLYEQAERAAVTAGAMSSPDSETIEQAIRQVLHAVTTLTSEFAGRPVVGLYAANIMLFRTPAQLSPDERHAVQQRLRFVDDGTSIDLLKGVLDLECKLSMALPGSLAETAALPQPDPNIQPLALAVPTNPQTRHENGQVLPGAPVAFVKGEPDGYEGAKNIETWFDQKGDFTKAIQDEVLEYFRQSRINSFVSIPLHKPSVSREKTDPIGVLNIHSDQMRFLPRFQESGCLLFPILRPFQSILTGLLDLYKPLTN